MTTTGPLGRGEPQRVEDAWAEIARHPYEYLVRRWNWKTAVISAILRGVIFLRDEPERRA